MIRYSIIHEKNPREIVLLRGKGCAFRRCAFCDYHLDSSSDIEENKQINKEVLSHVTGIYRHLEVINSGSFPEIDSDTIQYILDICRDKHIDIIHIECHYMYRDSIASLRKAFANTKTELKVKIGVETFDSSYREQILKKGIPETDPATISQNFDECCLLFGLSGQTVESMINDIETGLAYFERVCVNIMNENSTKIKPDNHVISLFEKNVYPLYCNNERIDILMNNTDFGVGGDV